MLSNQDTSNSVIAAGPLFTTPSKMIAFVEAVIVTTKTRQTEAFAVLHRPVAVHCLTKKDALGRRLPKGGPITGKPLRFPSIGSDVAAFRLRETARTNTRETTFYTDAVFIRTGAVAVVFTFISFGTPFFRATERHLAQMALQVALGEHGPATVRILDGDETAIESLEL
jgi:hypothetical protein